MSFSPSVILLLILFLEVNEKMRHGAYFKDFSNNLSFIQQKKIIADRLEVQVQM